MIAIGALISMLTFVAAVALWLDRTVAQETAFLEHATEVLEMDSSQQALAELVMEKAIDSVPLLALVRGAGERAIVTILDSGVFDPAINNIVVAGHRRVMSDESGPFVADLSDVRDILVEPIARISPDLAGLIPADAFAAVVILDEAALPAVGRAAGWAPAVSVTAAAVAVFLAVAAVMLAERRAVAVTVVGLAVLIAGTGVVLWGLVGESLVAPTIDVSTSRVLVENGSAVFSRSLTAGGWWLVVAGFLIASAGLVGALVSAARGTNTGVETS